jgi:hypothetical protein
VFFREVLNEDLGYAAYVVANSGAPVLSKVGIGLVEGT